MLNAILNSTAFLGNQELLIIGFLILLIFGGSKIPQLMRGLGRGAGEFQKGLAEGKTAFKEATTLPEDDDKGTAKSS